MPSRNINLGILLPTRGLLLTGTPVTDANLILDMAHQAEAAGLHSVWVGDSLTAKPRLEPLLTLAAIASSTKKLRLGTAVLLAALRHPVLLAQMANTLDVLSSGRLILAVGAGGSFTQQQKEEWQVAGVSPSHRGRRLEEVMEIVQRSRASSPFSFKGQFFQLDNISINPKPVQPKGIPILFACHLRAGKDGQFLRTARLGDGYISISESPQEFAEVGRRIRGYTDHYERDFNAMESVFYMTINLNDDEAQAKLDADLYINNYYGINIWKDLWGPWGHPDKVADRIQQYASAGAKTIIVRFASNDPIRQLNIFLERVVPKI